MGTRINFVDVPEQKNFDVLPSGTYVCTISNLSTRYASEKSQNPGALILRWEFEVTQGDYVNRKLFDNQTCAESALWKVKAMLDAIGIDTDTLSYDSDDKQFSFIGEDGDEQELDMEELIGQTLELKVGVRPARKDPNTGQDYDKQNRVNSFYPHVATDEELLA
jgi:hypothetical protein